MTQDELKQAVAREAIKYVVDNAWIGVGSGSTANFFIDELAKNKHRIIRRAYADYWDQLLEQAMESGEFRADVNLAVLRLFLIGALNWTVEWFNPQRGTFKTFVTQITDIVFDGMAARSPAPRARVARKHKAQGATT